VSCRSGARGLCRGTRLACNELHARLWKQRSSILDPPGGGCCMSALARLQGQDASS
jgi:hypothetical protein